MSGAVKGGLGDPSDHKKVSNKRFVSGLLKVCFRFVNEITS